MGSSKVKLQAVYWKCIECPHPPPPPTSGDSSIGRQLMFIDSVLLLLSGCQELHAREHVLLLLSGCQELHARELVAHSGWMRKQLVFIDSVLLLLSGCQELHARELVAHSGWMRKQSRFHHKFSRSNFLPCKCIIFIGTSILVTRALFS